MSVDSRIEAHPLVQQTNMIYLHHISRVSHRPARTTPHHTPNLNQPSCLSNRRKEGAKGGRYSARKVGERGRKL